MSKYKFSLTPQIKGYVEWQLEHFHEDRKQLEQYKRDMIPSPVQSYSLTGGVQSGGTSNPTEKIGMRIANSAYILTTEKSVDAIEKVLSRCDPTDLKLIDLVYWQKAYTMHGAGMKAGLSERGAYYRINNILCMLAVEMGMVRI
jgi:RinA family phage transcriptional activator